MMNFFLKKYQLKKKDTKNDSSQPEFITHQNRDLGYET